MEFWFILAVASAVASGVAAYVAKIAAVHKIDMSVVALYAAFITTCVATALLLTIGSTEHLWHPMLWFALLGGGTYFVSTMLRVETLKLIDTAIFFPIYKVIGPLLAIGVGVSLFAEKFSNTEWFGLLLSLLVPLLLITRAEHARQNDLTRGLLLLLVIAIVAAVSISLMKAGSDIAINTWGYIVAGEFFVGLAAILLLLIRHRAKTMKVIRLASDRRVYILAAVLGLANISAATAVVFSFTNQGPLGIVYTVNSLYILIPIILSIIFYNEHWNFRKMAAIVLSIAALGLLG